VTSRVRDCEHIIKAVAGGNLKVQVVIPGPTGPRRSPNSKGTRLSALSLLDDADGAGQQAVMLADQTAER
jgi:hypothetical protein